MSQKAQSKENLEKRILFACAFGASIGGMATPIGSPPNLLAMEFLNQKGISISFLKWMTWGIPLSFALLIVLILLLHWKYPIKATHSKEIHQLFSKQLYDLGKMSHYAPSDSNHNFSIWTFRLINSLNSCNCI